MVVGRVTQDRIIVYYDETCVGSERPEAVELQDKKQAAYFVRCVTL